MCVCVWQRVCVSVCVRCGGACVCGCVWFVGVCGCVGGVWACVCVSVGLWCVCVCVCVRECV